jgi:hypothetical protein
MSVAPRELVAGIGKSKLYRFGLGLLYESGLAVDADGSPRAYHPESHLGLDDLSCAGHPGNWWGIATDQRGIPYVQKASDPAPGYYVSTTALAGWHRPIWDPFRYVDAEEIPFIVLPSRPHLGVDLGALGMAFNPATGDSSAFIYADIGPANQIGEGSIALAKNLGVNPSPRGGGAQWGIVTLIFPHTHRDWPAYKTDILNVADKNFLIWGGFNKLRTALPEIDWSKYP